MSLNKLECMGIGFVLGALISCNDKEKVMPDCTTKPLMSFETTDANCGLSEGKITLTATGGTSPYMFSINNSDYLSEFVFDSLAYGAYTVRVRDKNMCSSDTQIVINNISDISVDVLTTVSGCGGTAGSVNITSSGGGGTHLYSIDGINFQEKGIFSNLSAKEYSVVTKDEDGCSITTKAKVSSGVEFSTVIKPIIDQNCAISGCHVAGAKAPDLTKLANIKSNADNIKRKTGDRSMPLKGSLTSAQISSIACWVDDGAITEK